MGNRLYIGNLPFEATGKDLEELFSQAGQCESASVITDRATGQSRGFGFVEMASAADAAKAIQQFDGRCVGGQHTVKNSLQYQVWPWDSAKW